MSDEGLLITSHLPVRTLDLALENEAGDVVAESYEPDNKPIDEPNGPGCGFRYAAEVTFDLTDLIDADTG